eukprot:9500008-Pyramimonas_sp.AAC.2
MPLAYSSELVQLQYLTILGESELNFYAISRRAYSQHFCVFSGAENQADHSVDEVITYYKVGRPSPTLVSDKVIHYDDVAILNLT